MTTTAIVLVAVFIVLAEVGDRIRERRRMP